VVRRDQTKRREEVDARNDIMPDDHILKVYKDPFIMNVDDLLISHLLCLRLPIGPRRYFRQDFPTYSRT